MKVLIVEDEPLIGMYLEELVLSFGHEVCAIAASAPEAMANVERHAPHVCLMDVHLAAGTNGIDAANDIYSCHGVRSIFLSGNLDDATRGRLEPCRPIDFIDKPILPVSLRRALKVAERMINGEHA